MKKLLLTALMMFACSGVIAQEQVTNTQAAQKPFKGYFANEEHHVYIRINLYDDGMVIPEHDLYGNLPGYLAKEHNGFYWVITSATLVNDTKAEIELINDYGSEDLEATLTLEDDGQTLVLKQGSGSTIKVPDNGKWKKLPGKLKFTKR